MASSDTSRLMIATRMPTTALAFRGYNQTNLGRTPELLAAPAYRPTLERRLAEASQMCEAAIGRRVDLAARVADRVEADVDAYAEAIALVFAAELAQLDLLRDVHGVDPQRAGRAFGYSLGELTAVAAAGLYPIEAVMRIPLTLAEDCAAMAHRVTMAVVFSRKTTLSEAALQRVCEEVTAEGKGAIAISAIIAPNTMLVIGEGATLDRVRQRCENWDGPSVLLRSNDGVWPPLHTPLVSERHIPDRATLLIREVPRLTETPTPPIWSLVTGRREYEADSGRAVLRRWVDSPQRLWDVVHATLSSDVKTVLHVGPAPNVIPATFQRLAENVVKQTTQWSLSAVGKRTVQRMAGSAWMAPLLPRNGFLLRAPLIKQVILEDWLLENAPR
ncbi:hypothetical protein Pla108_20330 [Botrimarina colliarenosi]|uniref:[acyl-carrier-protein] S-malonyltransferase n=1 Tax=Botrimarina colliarenosi TaxID=2528001 RepID=A0A5C6AE43_9BACT|nr:ACP S-malonyltransferase [Botrimarina colliarenosi]TWT97879.1 hypothetical protein Pla108_20330 [Botrimarina colliarenosi]